MREKGDDGVDKGVRRVKKHNAAKIREARTQCVMFPLKVQFTQIQKSI